MSNWLFPSWPPFVLNGWQLLPTFPSTWYHPVKGAQTVATLAAFQALGPGWFPSPGLADMSRTETEAELVITNDVNAELMSISAGTPGSTTWAPAIPNATTNFPPVNRRSASWQQVRSMGWVAAQAAP